MELTNQHHQPRFEQRRIVVANIVGGQFHQFRLVFDAHHNAASNVAVNRGALTLLHGTRKARGQIAGAGAHVQDVAARLQFVKQQLQCVGVLNGSYSRIISSIICMYTANIHTICGALMVTPCPID